MQSAAAGHPTAEELLAFTDGEASSQVEGHVEGCTACATQVESFASMQAALRQTLYRFDCPAPHALGEYELGFVAPEERLRIATHAAECDDCALELRSLREFMQAEISVPETIVSQIRRVVATLFLPSARPGLAGIRGSESELRQYRVEGASISIGGGGEPGSLIGLLTLDRAERPHGEAHLLPTHGTPAIAPLDESGNFEFFELAAGEYALEIHLSDAIMVIQNVHVA